MFRGTNTVSKAPQSSPILQKTKSFNGGSGLPPVSPSRRSKGNGSSLVSPDNVTKETKQPPSQATTSPQATGAMPTRESQAQRDRQLHTTMQIANAKLQRCMLEYSSFHFEVGFAWLEIGNIYFECNNMRRAYQAYCKAIECTKGCQHANDTLHIALAHQAIGILHSNGGRMTKSIKRLDRAIHRIEKSEAQYGQSRQTVVAAARVHTSLGRVLMYNNDYSGALYELEKALGAQQRMFDPQSEHISHTRKLIAISLHQHHAIRNSMSGDTVIQSQIAAPVHSDKASLTSLSHGDNKDEASELMTSVDSGYTYVTLRSLSEANDDASYDSTRDDCLCSGPLDIVAHVLHSVISWVGGEEM